MQKYIRIEALEDSEGERWVLPGIAELGEKGDQPVTAPRAIRVLLLVVQNALNAGKMEMGDVGHGAVVLRACRKAMRGGFLYLTLDQDDYEWLEKFAATWGPKVFGFNYSSVKEALTRTMTEAERKAVHTNGKGEKSEIAEEMLAP